MTSQTILLTIWVVISILILGYSILNAVSLLSLETRVQKIDKNDGNTPLKIVVKNWDIVLASTVILLLIMSLFIDDIRGWYYNHIFSTTFLFLLVVVLCVVGILLKRIVFAQKYWKCDGASCVRDTSGGTEYTTSDCKGECTPSPR